MLPPYWLDVNPRCCSYPLLMLSACLDRASLAMYTGIERLHGTLCRSGGAHGHGTGPWDDITGVVKFTRNVVLLVPTLRQTNAATVRILATP